MLEGVLLRLSFLSTILITVSRGHPWSVGRPMAGSPLSKSTALVGGGEGRRGMEGVLLNCKGSTCDSMETFSGGSGSSETIANPFLFPEFGTWPISPSTGKENSYAEGADRPQQISSILDQMSKDGQIYHRHVKEVLPMLRLRKRHYQIKFRIPRDTNQQLKRGRGETADRDLIKRQVLKVLRL